MTNDQQRTREGVAEYLLTVKQELLTTEQNQKNEDIRQQQLTQTMQEIFKSKQKVKVQLSDLETLNETAGKRFHDLPT